MDHPPAPAALASASASTSAPAPAAAQAPASPSSQPQPQPPPYLDDLPPHPARHSLLALDEDGLSSTYDGDAEDNATLSGASSSSSFTGTSSSYDSEEEARLAQEEWDEGVAQLQLALQLVLLPYVGKYLGRRYAYTLWNRYLRYGPTWAFWGLRKDGAILGRMHSIVPNWAVALVSTAADAA